MLDQKGIVEASVNIPIDVIVRGENGILWQMRHSHDKNERRLRVSKMRKHSSC
jgi:hypothetical protein